MVLTRYLPDRSNPPSLLPPYREVTECQEHLHSQVLLVNQGHAGVTYPVSAVLLMRRLIVIE